MRGYSTVRVLLLAIFAYSGTAFQVDFDEAQNPIVLFGNATSCTYNTDTSVALCSSKQSSKNVQYTHVRNITMCSYHHCLLYDDQLNTLSCSGYIFALYDIFQTKVSYLNPLTPIADRVGFHAEQTDVIWVKTLFRGTNLFIETFEQNIESTWADSRSIEYVTCREPFGTCIKFTDEVDDVCFGGYSYAGNMYEAFSSALLGISFSTAFAFVLFHFAYLFHCDQFTIYSRFMTMYIILPLLVLIICTLASLQHRKWIVTLVPWGLGSMLGVLFGYGLAIFLMLLYSRAAQRQRVRVFNDGSNERLVQRTRTLSFDHHIDSSDDEDHSEIYETTHDIHNKNKIELSVR